MKLIEKVNIKGTITLLTGLHIGGTKTSMDIGGLDSPVIKTPQGVPYIPGSSLKGKLRSLLAKKTKDAFQPNDDDILIRQMFGCAGGKNSEKVKVPEEITRLITRDAYLDEKHFKETFTNKKAALETSFTEAKYENIIDRKSGTAKHPRQIERVPAGAVFNFEMVLDVYEESEKTAMLTKLKEGFKLLEDDYLGGSGTRGYGQIKIEFDKATQDLLSV